MGIDISELDSEGVFERAKEMRDNDIEITTAILGGKVVMLDESELACDEPTWANRYRFAIGGVSDGKA